MADPPKTKAGAPPNSKGGGKGDGKILGMDKTMVIVVAGAFGLALVYFWMKGKQSPQGSGGGKSGGPQHNPTGLQRQHLTIWVRDHGGHRGR